MSTNNPVDDPTPPLFRMLRRITAMANDTSEKRLSDIELYQIGYNLSVYMIEIHGRKLYPSVTNPNEKDTDLKIHFGYGRASYVMDWVWILNSTRARTKKVNLAMSGTCATSEKTSDNIPLDILNFFKDMQRMEEVQCIG